MAAKALKLCALALAAITAPIAMAQQASEVVVYGPAPKPVPVPGAKPITAPSFDAFKGDGLYYFQGTKVSNMRVAGAAGDGNRYPIAETSSDSNQTTLNGNIDVAHAVLNGERRALGRPNFAIPANDGSVYIVYAGQAPLRMAVTLQGYDVSECRSRCSCVRRTTIPSRKRQGGQCPVPEGLRGLPGDRALLR